MLCISDSKQAICLSERHNHIDIKDKYIDTKDDKGAFVLEERRQGGNSTRMNLPITLPSVFTQHYLQWNLNTFM